MKRFLLIFVCLVFLNGCSTKVAYNFLDFAFKWYVGGYVSLERDQKKQLDIALDEFHKWHRQTQLPLYADYLEGTIDTLESETIDGKWIHQQTDELQILMDNSVNKLFPALVELMHNFSDEQGEELLDNLAAKREKYNKKEVEVSAEKQQKNRITDLSDQLDQFFGRYTDEQKDWIEQWAQDLHPYEELTLTQQALWAERIGEALAIRHDREQLSGKLREIMFYRTDDWDPELEAILDHNQAITYDLIAKLINNQTAKQRKKMLKKLENYRKDFLDLHAKAEKK